MKLLVAFFRMIRWQNLVFIIITQLLFYYCICRILYPDHPLLNIALVVVASVFIAAAGYIINDYFDLNIDQVNKPSKNVINAVISRRWAIVWHLGLSMAGVAITALAVGREKWWLILANLVTVILLWFYSTSLKRQPLIGNIVISLLTAWTILFIFFAQAPVAGAIGTNDEQTVKFFRVAFLYAGFAFVISLIREAIKDVEDIEGDRRYGCKTFPIVAGIFAMKVYTTVWLIVLLSAVIILQLYVMQFGWWWAIIYAVIFIIIPLFYLFRAHTHAQLPTEFRKLSRLTKFIMLAGIISMIFFRIYF
jgi:4-hydroxybenzoate polyprenyltransferase